MFFDLRFGIFYLAFVAISVTAILLVVASMTFQKPVNNSTTHQKINWKTDWVWAMIPLMMLLVLLIPVINLFLHQGS